MGGGVTPAKPQRTKILPSTPRCLEPRAPKPTHTELSNFYYIEWFALVTTYRRTNEFLSSINTDLKWRPRRKVSNKTLIPSLPAVPGRPANIPLHALKHALPPSHGAHLPANKRKCLLLPFKPFFLEGSCSMRWKEQRRSGFWVAVPT